MEDAIPKWLIAALGWGGAALAVLSAATLILIMVMAVPPPAEAGRVAALFLIALFVGIVAAVIGFVVGRKM